MITKEQEQHIEKVLAIVYSRVELRWVLLERFQIIFTKPVRRLNW